MDNLAIFNRVASVPENAQKRITAGRLKGMTDINPMWRIKMLTEEFGICGVGWKYIITDKRFVEGADGAVCVFLDIDLFIKVDGQWSDAIPGTGGSQFVSLEQKGKYTNDECLKMALTDAISVACKALGFGADVYWAAGRSKYNNNNAGDNGPDNFNEGDPQKNFRPVVNIPTYEQALEMKVGDKTLKDLYHEDIKAVRAMYDAPDTDPEIKEAIRVIEKEISRQKAAK